ncbi:protein FAM189A2 isoform X3 [Acanthochromis polyacanthus]|uniref:protein FAM189A2 isoform X3 n=1 Tax=Acanthochromis polyacanthus TaxID=80966 RepID=UPI0022341D5A|nr:protein FAM189A2 isoform X3 [Acanthochromis polyacanthus]
MSLPVVLPGSCCPFTGASHLAESSNRNRHRGFSGSSRISGRGSRLLLPGRPLLSLGLLQLLLGGSMVALSFGALSLSSSPPIRNSSPFWAGSSVILSGIVGLTTWRRPMLLLVNVFILLSVVCVFLNLAGFIMCCQGAQLISSTTSCQLKVLFALCALSALTTAVCLMAAALRYLQIFTARTPYMDEPRATVENMEEAPQSHDPDEFVAPAPPPSYFSTFCSYTPHLSRRMLGNSVIPLLHIYGARIKGVEVFCPLDPPPPYAAAVGSSANAATQETELNQAARPPGASVQVLDMSPQMVSASPNVVQKAKPQPQLHPTPSPPLPPPPPPPQQQQKMPALMSCRKKRICRSNSDPVLNDLSAKVWISSDAPLAHPPQTTDSSTQTSQPMLAAHTQVTLRRGKNSSRTPRQPRPRPTSMVDYQSYQHTQHLVRKILEQPAVQGLAPEVQELVDSIRNVLQSDQEHMEEAVRCASYIEQVFTDSNTGPTQPKPPQQPRGTSPQTFPHLPEKWSCLLHLQSCGDLSSFSCAAVKSLEHQGKSETAGLRGSATADSRGRSRLDHSERAHSLTGVFRETVL